MMASHVTDALLYMTICASAVIELDCCLSIADDNTTPNTSVSVRVAYAENVRVVVLKMFASADTLELCCARIVESADMELDTERWTMASEVRELEEDLSTAASAETELEA
jgi:hypothetical protein